MANHPLLKVAGFQLITPGWFWVIADSHTYPDLEFHYLFGSSSIPSDGGILYIHGKLQDRLSYPMLIAEVKNQGRKDLRAQEGLPRQAMSP